CGLLLGDSLSYFSAFSVRVGECAWIVLVSYFSKLFLLLSDHIELAVILFHGIIIFSHRFGVRSCGSFNLSFSCIRLLSQLVALLSDFHLLMFYKGRDCRFVESKNFNGPEFHILSSLGGNEDLPLLNRSSTGCECCQYRKQ